MLHSLQSVVTTTRKSVDSVMAEGEMPEGCEDLDAELASAIEKLQQVQGEDGKPAGNAGNTPAAQDEAPGTCDAAAGSDEGVITWNVRR